MTEQNVLDLLQNGAGVTDDMNLIEKLDRYKSWKAYLDEARMADCVANPSYFFRAKTIDQLRQCACMNIKTLEQQKRDILAVIAEASTTSS
jgi:hypothetical protein